MLSHSVATSRFDGLGSPWLMIVDSSATIGLPAVIAAETSAEYLIALFTVTTLADEVRRYAGAFIADNSIDFLIPWTINCQ